MKQMENEMNVNVPLEVIKAKDKTERGVDLGVRTV